MSRDATNEKEGVSLISVSNRFALLSDCNENEFCNSLISNKPASKLEIRLKNVKQMIKVEPHIIVFMFPYNMKVVLGSKKTSLRFY